MQKAEDRRHKAKSCGQSAMGSLRNTTLLRWRISRLVFCLLLSAYCLLPSVVHGQQVVDKMVATVNAGGLPECRQVCLINYSDVLWQLALQPNTPLDNPSSAELNRPLHLLTDQQLILQEAEKLPSIAPTADEVASARNELA